MALVHTPSTQSVFVLHALSAGQCWQTLPPQSISDSSPFFTASKQVGAFASPPVSLPARLPSLALGPKPV